MAEINSRTPISLDAHDSQHGEIRDLDFDAPKGFSTIRRGALTYIVNSRGEVISGGFHDFKPLRVIGKGYELRILLGTLGSQTFILNALGDGQRIETRTQGHHQIEYRKDLRSLVVRSGAMLWLLDPLSGEHAHLQGYHSIERRGSDYYGIVGATTERINISSELPPVVSDDIDTPLLPI